MGWRRFFRRGWWDEERSRELQAYLEIETDDNVARGMSYDEARAAAQRKLGNPVRIREEIYAMNTLGVVDRLWQDLRYGARVFARSPGFTAAAVITLALGIGGVTIIYSIIRNVLLDPFPYADSSRMIDLFVVDAVTGGRRGELTAGEFLDYQEQASAFEGIIGTISPRGMTMPSREGAQLLAVSQVTPNTFEFLGVRALIGRGIADADAAPGAPPVIVLSHEAWVSTFGASEAVIGQPITVDDETRTIVGVMPPRFTWHVADGWVPRLPRRGEEDAATRQFWFQARLKPGVTLEQAESEMYVIAARRAADHPDDYPKRFRMSVITVIDFVVGRFRGVLYTLFGAVGLLLLIACCNVANMLLARATAREREFTVRGALGASRGRLMGQLMIESLLLALAGAVAGCLIAYGGIKTVAYFMPRQGVAYEVELRLDRWALLFSLATAIGTAVIFGLLPAWHGAKRDLVDGLKASSKGSGSRASQGWLRNGIVIGEVALSLVLLLGAAVLMHRFMAMVDMDLGFDTSRLIVATARFPEGRFEAAGERQRYTLEGEARLRALPGVVAVAHGSNAPYGGIDTGVERPGVEQERPRDAAMILCSETYLPTIGVSAIRGRLLDAADIAGARPVAVVNQSLATLFFGTEDPIGQTIRLTRLARLPEKVDPHVEIVGVVKDIRNRGLRAPAPGVFIPSTIARRNPNFLIRTAADPAPMLETIRRTLRSADLSVPIDDAVVLEAQVARRYYSQPRFSLIVLSAFAVVGLLLVAVGVYGVMAYVVSQRTREIAIRMALGAGRPDTLRAVLRTGAVLLIAGIGVGLLASLGTNRLLPMDPEAPLPRDQWTTGAAVAVIAVVGLLACFVPALRASRVDPIVALRQD